MSLSLTKFAGKVAVVTGASAGIGKAIAEELVKQGVIVAGIARRAHRIRDHAKELTAAPGHLHAYQCDLLQQDQILATFKQITTELGPIHILINNAGFSYNTSIINGDNDQWKAILDVNVLALAICTREAIASMKAHNLKGHVININSVGGHIVVDFPGASVYIATKHAVTALTETVRLEINREKLPIKITSLSPGYVKTEAFYVAFGEAAEAILNGRPGLESKDIADAALYILATPDHVNVKELIISVQGADH